MEFFIRNRTIVALISFSLFSIISLSIQSSTFTMSVEGVGSALTLPFQRMYDGFQGGIGRFWAGFTELSDLREELRDTRSQLQRYESTAEELSEIKRENERLRQLLGLRDMIEYRSLPATIISKDPDNWFRTLVINRGRRDGIKKDMPVVAYTGETKAVIGRVIEVRNSISRIEPIISPALRIGVRLQDSRYPGLMYGYSTRSNLCIVDYISRNAAVVFGAMVITSGQGGVFPPGLPVGTVVKTENVESSAYQRAVIKPLIDYNLLEDVFVILKSPDPEFLEFLQEER